MFGFIVFKPAKHFLVEVFAALSVGLLLLVEQDGFFGSQCLFFLSYCSQAIFIGDTPMVSRHFSKCLHDLHFFASPLLILALVPHCLGDSFKPYATIAIAVAAFLLIILSFLMALLV